jgi:hypothetical protein
MFQTIVLEKIKTHFMLNDFFRKTRRLSTQCAQYPLQGPKESEQEALMKQVKGENTK